MRIMIPIAVPTICRGWKVKRWLWWTVAQTTSIFARMVTMMHLLNKKSTVIIHDYQNWVSNLKLTKWNCAIFVFYLSKPLIAKLYWKWGYSKWQTVPVHCEGGMLQEVEYMCNPNCIRGEPGDDLQVMFVAWKQTPMDGHAIKWSHRMTEIKNLHCNF